MQRENTNLRPVALLDVDHTLVFSKGIGKNRVTVYNDKLLAALKEKGIKDVYLFTDMFLTKSEVEDRLKLIEHLKSQGFTVHGVLSPSDGTWNLPNTEDIYEKTSQDKKFSLKSGQQGLSPFYNLVAQPEYKEIKNFISNPTQLATRLGGAFKDAADNIKHNNYATKYATKSYACKTINEITATQQGFLHPKGLMFQQFMKNMPSWVSSAVVCDDKEEAIASVMQANQQAKMPVKLIHVSDQNTDSKEHYLQELGPTIREQIAADIDRQIKKLKHSNWNILKIAGDRKITVLEQIKKDILDPQLANNKNTRQIIENSLKKKFTENPDDPKAKIFSGSDIIDENRSTIISRDRFFFRDKKSETNTRKFIIDLQEKYAKFALGDLAQPQAEKDKKGKEEEKSEVVHPSPRGFGK